MDGYAIRSGDAEGATDRAPAVLDVADAGPPHETTLPAAGAVRVHTGSALPEDADAVVPIEDVTEVDGAVELSAPVAGGQHVAPVGEDVTAGQHLFEAGHRLRPSDLGLLKVAGLDRVPVRQRPDVGVVPTGEELVQTDPGPGEAVETNGLTVAGLAERWGARTEYRDVVSDDPAALRAAIQRDLTKDVVVTMGGTSVGERDHLPEVLEALGTVLVHGVGLQPGHPVALGVVEETPVLCLPGYPVSCIVTAVQFLRPVVARLQGTTPEPVASQRARLDRKLDSEPGIATFARVTLRERSEAGPTTGERADAGADPVDADGGADPADADAGADPADADPDAGIAVDAGGEDASDGEALPVASPTRTRGAGVLSSVALADGWVVVPPDREGLAAESIVAVERWEAHP